MSVYRSKTNTFFVLKNVHFYRNKKVKILI